MLKKQKVKPAPDNPWKAIEWQRMRLVDENDNIPEKALEKALYQRALMIGYYKEMGLPGKADLSSGIWKAKGPTNVGGRTRSLVIDPQNSNRLITGSVGGGIWISENGGIKWEDNNGLAS